MSFGGPLEPGSDDMMSDINMTPLVDVMLVLVIVFMVTIPVLTHAVRVELPRASQEVNLVKPQTITLSVDRDAVIHWNGERIAAGELAERLRGRATESPQPEVHIRGDRAVGYEHVLRVMAAVQKSGLTKIGFVSEPEGN